MAFELNYKVDGDILYGADLMENMGFSLTSSLNYAIDGATTTNQDNFIQYSDVTYTNINTDILFANANYAWQSDNYGVYGGNVYDSYDGSVDAAKWDGTVGTQNFSMSEVANTYVQGAVSANLDAIISAKALDLHPSGGTGGCIVTAYYAGASGGGTATMRQRLYLRDETGTEVLMYDNSLGGQTSMINTYEFFLDFTSENSCTVYKDGTSQGAVDISSLDETEDWHLRFYSYVDGGSGPSQTIRVYPIVYTNGAALDAELTATSDSETVATSSLWITKLVGDNVSSITNSISLDASDFTAIVQKTVQETASTGTAVQLKHVFPAAATDQLPRITNYGVYYS